MKYIELWIGAGMGILVFLVWIGVDLTPLLLLAGVGFFLYLITQGKLGRNVSIAGNQTGIAGGP